VIERMLPDFGGPTVPQPKSGRKRSTSERMLPDFGWGLVRDLWYGQGEGMAVGGGRLGRCCNDLASVVWAPSRDSMEADHHV